MRRSIRATAVQVLWGIDMSGLQPFVGALITLIVGASAATISYFAFRYNFQVNVEKIVLDRKKHIHDWGDEVIEQLASAFALTYWDPEANRDEFFRRRNDLMARFSALVDRGRLFFPNMQIAGKGEHKEEAFKGGRQRILDHIVDAFDVTKNLDLATQQNNKPMREQLVSLKRKFVSDLQIELDPRSFSSRLARLADRAQAADPNAKTRK
jgi:hypothetical protein